MANKRPYEPLDVADPRPFIRVKGPPPEFDDPNDPDGKGGIFDFDIETMDGARNAVRPIALLLAWGAITRIVMGVYALVNTDLDAYFSGAATDAQWVSAIDGFWMLFEAMVFSTIGVFVFFRSRIAAVASFAVLVWLVFLKFAIIAGWLEGSLLSGLIYIGLFGGAVFLAIGATFNYHKMTKLGVDRLSEPDDEPDSTTSPD